MPRADKGGHRASPGSAWAQDEKWTGWQAGPGRQGASSASHVLRRGPRWWLYSIPLKEGASLPEASESKAQGGNGERRERDRERVLRMLFELPDPACVMSYETQLCQLTLDFRYTMFFFFFFLVHVCPHTIFETYLD